MSWKGGSDVCIEVWESIRFMIPLQDRPKALALIIKTLENHDWDGPGRDIEIQKWPELAEALELSGHGD